jgi:membrane fusion protein (multidrug efflux system)
MRKTLENSHGRAVRISLIVLFAVIVIAGAGFIYLQAASREEADPGSDGAESAAERTAENGQEEEEEEEAAVPVSVAEAEVGSISTYITATANLVPENEVQVLAEAEGRVTQLRVEEGDRVQRGLLLAALLRDEAEMAHNKAELKAANAELAFNRAASMVDQDLISREDYDRIAMDHRIVQQELAEAAWRLEKTEIRAPFTGRVTRRSITLGQHVRPGDELFVVTDFDPLVARIYLPEKDVLSLREGREVEITLKADETVAFAGSIRQISPVVDTATGTVKITVEAIEPPVEVRPGGFVTIGITRETHSDALLLPREAVIRELQEAHVFVVDGDLAKKRTVRLGLEEGDRLEIVEGIERGERIIVAGQGGLKDGTAIKILQQETDQTAAADETTDRRSHG